MMAADTTGLVRAAVSEALPAMAPDEWLGTVVLHSSDRELKTRRGWMSSAIVFSPATP